MITNMAGSRSHIVTATVEVDLPNEPRVGRSITAVELVERYDPPRDVITGPNEHMLAIGRWRVTGRVAVSYRR